MLSLELSQHINPISGKKVIIYPRMNTSYNLGGYYSFIEDSDIETWELSEIIPDSTIQLHKAYILPRFYKNWRTILALRTVNGKKKNEGYQL